MTTLLPSRFQDETDPAFAALPSTHCYAVIFASRRRLEGALDGGDGYAAMAEDMLARAVAQPGFLGVESARGEDGFGLTVSYWQSLEDIARWKADAHHQIAQQAGRDRWYSRFALRIARVERIGSV